MSPAGRVSLVGAGPGDPGLLTLRGAELLRQADVVVYDRLAPAELLDLAPADAERIYAGKQPGNPTLDQDQINATLIEYASAGKHVVRLKGGDPFVFGRGGEEALACAEAGIPVELVPGVSSAIAAPEMAGIPLTHRGLAKSVAFVAGAAAAGGDPGLSKVAAAADTLVVLMAAERLAEACATLIEAGRPADEPAALIRWATTPEQEIVIGTLSSLPTDAAHLGPPAVLVCGPTVTLATMDPED